MHLILNWRAKSRNMDNKTLLLLQLPVVETIISCGDHQVVSIVSVLLKLRVDSDSEEKMGDELTILLEAFHKIEKAGGQATLSLSTSSGKTKVKLETSTTAAPPSVSPSQPASSTTGRRHRRRGARARARRNLRAAAHQASLGEAATSVPPDPPRPLQLHPSPPPASGRRKVTTVARPCVPSFHTLNVDGPPPPTPPPPPVSIQPFLDKILRTTTPT